MGRRRPPSYLKHWPMLLRAVLVLGLVLWLLWVFMERVNAPPRPRPPPPDTILFVEPDAAP